MFVCEPRCLQRHFIPLDLELHVVVRYPMSVLETELRASAKTDRVLSFQTIFLAVESCMSIEKLARSEKG